MLPPFRLRLGLRAGVPQALHRQASELFPPGRPRAYLDDHDGRFDDLTTKLKSEEVLK